MSASDPATRQAVWDLAEQLADRPETITVSVVIDRWGRRKISVDIHAIGGAEVGHSLLRSYRVVETTYELLDDGAWIVNGIVKWRGTDIPVSVFAAGEPE